MKIRTFKKEDAGRCIEIMLMNKKHMGDIYDVPALIKSSGYNKYFIAEENGEVLGMIGFSDLNNRIGMLASLCVDLKTQGKGIGHKLVKKVKSHAKKNNFKKVLLLTHEKNKPMMILAIKEDFIPEGSLRSHFRDGKDVTYFSYFI